MAALDNIASELLKSANEADLIYKRTRDQAQRDKAVRLRRIVENLRQLGGGTATLDQVTTAGNTTANTINVGGITSDYFQFDTAATPTLTPGMFAWNDAYGTADLRLKGNNVTLQVGQETLARVVNKTGSDLLESQYKVVRVRIASEGGAQGQRLAVVLAQGNNDPDSATTLGIVTEDIPNNQEGFITIFGNVNNINTTGSLQGETWVDGDVLYLSPTTPGSLTKVKPVAPQHTVIIGYVVYAHNNQGKIFVKVDNGYELDELHNVLITSPANNDLLQYNSAQQVWKNIPVGTAVPTPTLAQVTTAGNTTTNAITVGSVNSNGNVVIGGAASSGAFQSYNGFYAFSFGTNVSAYNPNNNYTRIHMGASITYTDNFSGNFLWRSAGASVFEINNATINFWNTSSTIVTKHNASTGNFLIGTTTDAGYRLDVNGTTRLNSSATVSSDLSVGLTAAFGRFNVRGADNLSSSRAITVQNQSQTLIFDLYNDGKTLLNPQGTGNVLIGTTTDAGYKLDVNGTARIQGNTEISRSGADTQLTVARGGGASFTIQGKANSTSQSEGVNLYWTNNTWLKFVLGSSVVANFSNVGNLLVGTSTDAGYKLDVNGTARLTGALYQTTAATSGTLIASLLSGSLTIEKYEENGFNLGSILIKAKNNSALQNSIVIDYAGIRSLQTIRSDGEISIGTGSGGALRWASNSAQFGWRINVGTNFGIQSAYANSSPTWSEYFTIIHQTQTGAGNVGIGTTTPTDKFHIVDNTNGNKFARISAGGTDASAAWVAQNDQVDNVVYRVFGSAVTGSQMGQALARSASLIANLGGTGKFLIGSFSSTDLIFGTSDQARMRLVDATGNFLIGTMTDTGNKLTVSGNIDAQGYKVNNVLGYTGILNIPTNPPGQQNIDIQGGIVINIF